MSLLMTKNQLNLKGGFIKTREAIKAFSSIGHKMGIDEQLNKEPCKPGDKKSHEDYHKDYIDGVFAEDEDVVVVELPNDIRFRGSGTIFTG
jgi:hypothetical protein